MRVRLITNCGRRKLNIELNLKLRNRV